ncbi:MAG: PD-(D/E)XK nuclease family protein [Coriobacteriia bacterium]|nr:PD-(D/E)XK nuclease family protein [Coriobacteriia bacterium]
MSRATTSDQAASQSVRPEGLPRTTELCSQQQYALNQVSASDIQLFHQCPRSFYLQRVLRLGQLVDRSPSKASNRGSLIHLLLEWGTTDQAETLFARHHVSAQQAQELLAVVETFQKSPFMQQLLADSQLVKEHAFYLKLSADGQTPRYLKGFIDALTWQNDTTLLIIDYKTGRGATTAANYQAQADCYALAGLAQGAQCVQVLMLRPEVTDAHGDPETFRFDYRSDQTQQLRQSLLATIEAMEDAHNASLVEVDPKNCSAFCTVPAQLCIRKEEIEAQTN